MSILPVHKQPDAAKAFANYYQPYETDLNTRSKEINYSDIRFAYVLYQKGDYNTAYEMLNDYNKKVNHNYTALFYFGLSALELNKFNDAEESLKEVSIDSNTSYSLHADWYLSMLYLKFDRPFQAENYLEHLASGNNYYTKKARKILRKYF